MPRRVWRRFVDTKVGEFKKELEFKRAKAKNGEDIQPAGTNLCAYYVCEMIRRYISELVPSDTNAQRNNLRMMLSPEARFRPLQEELAGWFSREVLHPKGEHYYEDVELYMH